MNKILSDKKVIFFDVGYTLDYPVSGDWMLTQRFTELAGDKLKRISDKEFADGYNICLDHLLQKHKVTTTQEECQCFADFYAELSARLELGLSMAEIESIAHDRTYNMGIYRPYPDAKAVVERLSRSFKLGIISDTWPSIEPQLEMLGVNPYFSFRTYSFTFGVMKPDKTLYLDALSQCGCEAHETVFIDDSVRNLQGAAELGITPILIAANPTADVETDYCKIHSLTELLG